MKILPPAAMYPFRGVFVLCFGAHNTRTAGNNGITPTAIDMKPSTRVGLGGARAYAGVAVPPQIPQSPQTYGLWSEEIGDSAAHTMFACGMVRMQRC